MVVERTEEYRGILDYQGVQLELFNYTTVHVTYTNISEES